MQFVKSRFRVSLTVTAMVVLSLAFGNFKAVKGGSYDDDAKCNSTLSECKDYKRNERIILAKSPILPDTQDVKLLCDHVKDIESCLRKENLTCQNYLDGAVSRFLNAYSYLCEEEPLYYYLKDYDCLMNNTVREDCLVRAVTGDNDKDKCKMFTIEHECLQRSLLNNCGERTMKHFNEFNNRLLRSPCKPTATVSASSSGRLWWSSLLALLHLPLVVVTVYHS